MVTWLQNVLFIRRQRYKRAVVIYCVAVLVATTLSVCRHSYFLDKRYIILYNNYFIVVLYCIVRY